MPQDSFHIKRLALELHSALVGGKINRISQVSKDELTFIVYTGKGTTKLIISTNATGARVCVSATEKEPLAVAPNFCMLLRKHLQNAEILSVQQHETERIIQIKLHCTTDFSQSERTLVCELMGKYSNVVLVENGVVLGALKTTALMDDNHRVLLAGARYLYPAPQDKISPINGAEMQKLFNAFAQVHSEGYDSETLSKFVFENVAGFAFSTARELVKKAEKAGVPLSALGDFIADKFATEPCCPCLQQSDGVPTDFFAFLVEGGKGTDSLMQAEDEYYTYKETKKSFEDKRRKLESAVNGLRKKAQKRLQETLERLQEAEKAEENRIKGELLTANLYRIERGAKCAELENWYDENFGKVKIALDPTLSPAQNAQRYFKTYNKQKRAKEILLPMRKRDEAEISYAESVSFAIRRAESGEDIKEIETELIEAGLMRAPAKKINAKKVQTEIPFREFEYGGFTMYVGRNNIQNDRLVRSASAEDIWLHAQKYHSSHVIIKTENKDVPDGVLLFAAELCAYYSEGKEADKIPVDYCKRKYVKKPSKSKAGFVVYTDYKTLLVQPRLPQKEKNE